MPTQAPVCFRVCLSGLHTNPRCVVESTLLRASLDIEHHYSIMYSFAPANHALTQDTTAESGGGLGGQRERADLSALAEQATHASRQILTTVVDVLRPLKLLSYLPVRCWLCIVSANLHLLKVSLPHPIYNNGHSHVHTLRPLSWPDQRRPTRTEISNCYGHPSRQFAKGLQMTPIWLFVIPASWIFYSMRPCTLPGRRVPRRWQRIRQVILGTLLCLARRPRFLCR